jgi:uncharacterized membrane protein
MHLLKKFPILVAMTILNALLQLLCVGVVMGKSVGLLDLVSNFIGLNPFLSLFPTHALYRRGNHPPSR